MSMSNKTFQRLSQVRKHYRYNPEIKHRCSQVNSSTISTPKHHTCLFHCEEQADCVLWYLWKCSSWRHSTENQYFYSAILQGLKATVQWKCPHIRHTGDRFSIAIMLLSIMPYVCMSLWLKIGMTTASNPLRPPGLINKSSEEEIMMTSSWSKNNCRMHLLRSKQTISAITFNNSASSH
jgi:hypothetical protein